MRQFPCACPTVVVLLYPILFATYGGILPFSRKEGRQEGEMEKKRTNKGGKKEGVL